MAADELDPVPADPAAPQVEAHLPPGVTRGEETLRAFRAVLANTLVANVTSSFLWFALTFWAYLETRSVMATAIIGGGFMLFTALAGTWFGTLVDRHRKKHVMVVSSTVTLVTYAASGGLWLLLGEDRLADWESPWFWLFAAVILVGGVVESLRNIALSTTVTLLVPEDGRDRANGLVGTTNGIAWTVTPALSGLAIGQLGMGWCLVIAVVLTGFVTAHLLTIRIEEEAPPPSDDDPRVLDIGGAVRAVSQVPDLFALLLFSTLNNFLGGVFTSLVDPYGLTLVTVEAWGILLAIMSLGLIVGGIAVARRGLGSNPLRTLLVANVVMWVVTIVFPIRSEILPLTIGFFIYLVLVPVAEASEQTIIQKVVPFSEQGRVFGFGQSLESAASPITAFLIGPIAQLWVLPSMTDGSLADLIGPWFGTGVARGMALIFITAGVIGLIVTIGALRSGPYRRLSRRYVNA